MSSHIDPYCQWLGIKNAHRPPTHYELLGLARFESDRERIENAEMIQLAKVLRHEHGPHAALVEQLCRELGQAARCLGNPDDKAAYDADLFMAPSTAPTASEDVQATFAMDPPLPEERASKEQDAEEAATDSPWEEAATDAMTTDPDPLSLDLLGEEEHLGADREIERADAPVTAATVSEVAQEWPPPVASKKKKRRKQPSPARKGPAQRPTKATAGVASPPAGLRKKRVVMAGAVAAAALIAWLGMSVLKGGPNKTTVLSMISSTDPKVRVAGLNQMHRIWIDETEAVQLLLKVLREDPIDDVRIAAANALVNEGVSSSHLGELKPLLNQERQPSVKAALEWLVQGTGN